MEHLLEQIYASVLHLNRKRFPPAPSSQGSDNWRNTRLNAYDPERRPDDTTLPCVALGGRYEHTVVKAAHIYHRSWDRSELVSRRANNSQWLG